MATCLCSLSWGQWCPPTCRPLEVGHHAGIPEGYSLPPSSHSVHICSPGGLILYYPGGIHNYHHQSPPLHQVALFPEKPQWGPERVDPSSGQTTTSLKPGGDATPGSGHQGTPAMMSSQTPPSVAIYMLFSPLMPGPLLLPINSSYSNATSIHPESEVIQPSWGSLVSHMGCITSASKLVKLLTWNLPSLLPPHCYIGGYLAPQPAPWHWPLKWMVQQEAPLQWLVLQ